MKEIDALRIQVEELSIQLEDARIEREAALSAYEELQPTRERHALNVIAEIAKNVALGDTSPTVESVWLEFQYFVARYQGDRKVNQNTLALCLEAMDDIVHGRLRTDVDE